MNTVAECFHYDNSPAPGSPLRNGHLFPICTKMTCGLKCPVNHWKISALQGVFITSNKFLTGEMLDVLGRCSVPQTKVSWRMRKRKAPGLIILWVINRFSRVQLCVTPWTVAHQAPLSMEFSKQEYWSGLSCPPPGDRPDPRIKPAFPASPALQVDSLPTELPGKPLFVCNNDLFPSAHSSYVSYS